MRPTEALVPPIKNRKVSVGKRALAIAPLMGGPYEANRRDSVPDTCWC